MTTLALWLMVSVPAGEIRCQCRFETPEYTFTFTSSDFKFNEDYDPETIREAKAAIGCDIWSKRGSDAKWNRNLVYRFLKLKDLTDKTRETLPRELLWELQELGVKLSKEDEKRWLDSMRFVTNSIVRVEQDLKWLSEPPKHMSDVKTTGRIYD